MLQVAQNVEGIRTILERLLARPAARAAGELAAPVHLVNNLVSRLQQGVDTRRGFARLAAACILTVSSPVRAFRHTLAESMPHAPQDWYGSMNLMTFLRETGRFARVGTMLAKDSVRSRLESPQGISFTEFSYQLL
jgi:tRNA synthetases class I (W and Y)